VIAIIGWTRVVRIMLRAIHATEMFVGCLANPDEIQMVPTGGVRGHSDVRRGREER
jgi:hypothetical protein